VVLVFARTLFRPIMDHSRMRIGNSAASRCTQLLNLIGDVNILFWGGGGVSLDVNFV
jgi:hypothetical protein